MNKSLINTKKAYKERLEIIDLNLRVKSLNDIRLGSGNYYESGDVPVLDLEPFYQRDLVWTLEQKQSYVMNLFNGKAKITPTIVEYYKGNNHVYEVLDGKQRLSTLFEFIDNKFPLIVSGGEIYFKDLLEEDQKFIYKHDVRYTRIMHRYEYEVSDEDKLEIFLEKNLLGTKMADEHLKKVENELLKIREMKN